MASGTHYIALLRGINVGGKNLVRMAELREAFEELGFADVATYINSGNVLFRAPRQAQGELATRIEESLAARFGIELKVVLLAGSRLREIVTAAPEGFGGEDHKCDVIFLRPPLRTKRAMAIAELREGIDSAWPGKGVVYYSRLAARASGSRMGRIVMKPEYQDMTIRSWTTTRKLLDLVEERSG